MLIKNDDVLKVLGKKIKQSRLSKKYTQEYVAESIDISIDLLRNIENGRNIGSVPTLLNLCNFLNISPNFLFSELLTFKEDTLDTFLSSTIKSISNDDKELLKQIENSIILHGGEIYRAIVYGMMKNKIENTEKLDAFEIMKRLGIEIKIENKETVIYMKGKKIAEKELQSKQASMAVSKVSNVADNTKLYEFGRKLIDEYREKYNIILSSRDIVKMYPNVTQHFFIDASLEERTNRKYMQYNKEIPKEQIEEMIKSRDDLQEKSGYYRIYPQTKILDVTNCKSPKDAAQMVLQNIGEVVTNGI